MRTIWVKIDPWNKKLVTTALEGGADCIMVPKGYSQKVKELGKIQTVSEDGDLILGKDVEIFKLKSGKDEEALVKLSQSKKVILECSDWTIIPLENLIAQKADIIAYVRNYKEAETAFGILEKGVSAILFHSNDALELKKALSMLRKEESKTKLDVAEIIDIIPVGMGDRVCVDTCTSMEDGEGLLVGNSSNSLFLVHAESISNPYVAPRPFRVNAGAVHAYTKVPGGKTRYLSELEAGDSVFVTDFKGNVKKAVIGRLKIERRPLLLIKAVAQGKQIATIVQNAETIRLTNPDGKAVSVVSLKPGDKILVSLEKGARHFGYKIDETITEK